MNVRHLSTTLISNWDDCPKRAARSYLNRLVHGDDNEGTNPTRFGTVVHAVLEEIHHDLMTETIGDSGLDSDEIIMGYFRRHWSWGTCYDLEFFSLGSDKLGEFVRKSVRNRLGNTIATELLFVYDIVTEQVWVIDHRNEVTEIVDEILSWGGVPVVSEIDRLDRINEDTFEVHDYKTNILPFTRDQIENSKQLGVYDLVVRALYPEARNVSCVYDMLRHGRFPVEFNDDFRERLRAFLAALWRQIKATEEPEARINQYCRWCEIRSSCKAYAQALEAPIPPILTETTDTPEGIATLYAESERLSNLIKIAEERNKEIKGAIIAKVVQDGMGEPLQMGEREYYLIQNPRYEYDKAGVFKALEKAKSLILLPDIISISKQSVDRLIKRRPELKGELEHLVQKKFVSPTLKSRKLNGGKSSAEETDD
jgi:hypothetical protein